jgi:hypothetical protein
MDPIISNTQMIAINSDAAPLVDSFLSCPAAENLLSTQINKLVYPLFNPISLSVEVSDEVANESITGRIVISKQNANTPKGKSELISQMLRWTGGYKAEVLTEAIKGDMNADQFAYKMVESRYLSDKAHDDLMANCAKFWNIKKNELEANLQIHSTEDEPDDLEVRIWRADFFGVADLERSLWIDRVKKYYCPLHPEDRNSCRLKKEDLLLSSYENRPAEYTEMVVKRVCDKFLQAPKKVQKIFKYIAEEVCTSLLSLAQMNLTESPKQEL